MQAVGQVKHCGSRWSDVRTSICTKFTEFLLSGVDNCTRSIARAVCRGDGRIGALELYGPYHHSIRSTAAQRVLVVLGERSKIGVHMGSVEALST